MKSLFLLFGLSTILPFSLSLEQDLAKALAQGDVNTLVSYFDRNVEICMLEKTDFVSQREAKQILQTFFEEHSPSSYQQIHRGDSKGTSSYTIGLLTTQSGDYRIYLYYAHQNSKITIKEIRVDAK